MTRVAGFVLAVIVSCSGNAPAAELKLGLPIDCEVGKTCFVQQYTDIDPGAGVADYTCGGQSYDGHKGIDIRVRTFRDVVAGVNVLAASDGVVKGMRDGMADRIVRKAADRDAVADRECGNGVLLDHGDGWQTQYCHMRRGSVRVAKGAKVQAGDVLGQVGYSGQAGFAHVHLGVRKDGKVVDPFRGLDAAPGSCGAGARPLWRADALKALEYRRGQVLDAGFAGRALQFADIEAGRPQAFVPDAASGSLVAWGWAINLEAGDRVVVVLKGPGGEIARSSKVMPSRKAQYFAFAGKKRPGVRWPAGRYVTLFGVARNGKTVLRAGRAFVMK